MTTDKAHADSALKMPYHDPVLLEIIRHELVSIPNQIDKNIARTAFSPLISEYKDYAVGIVDPEGKLICQSRGSLAIFVANALGTAVQDGLLTYGANDLQQGDIVISNHAGTLGQHLNNVVMYTPVRVGPDARLICFFCVVMHWIDVGGKMIGSCTSVDTTEIFQEGIQLRSIKLIQRGLRIEEIFRVIEYNTRFPTMLLGDLEAQIAGCVRGCEETIGVAQSYGLNLFHAAIEAMWSRSDEAIRQAIARAPNGVYRAEAFLDDDGVVLGRRIPIIVTVEIENERVIVDLSEVADQVAGPVNAGRNGGAVAAARIAFKYLLSPEEPVNDGDFRRLEIRIPDGKFLSASPNAAIGSSGVMIPTTVDTILRALACAFPDRVAAGHHAIYGSHSIYGIRSATGAPFYNLETAVGGWGALADRDGYGPSRTNVHGDTSNVPSEMQEAYYPFRFERYELRIDSGGAGKHRGGPGVYKLYRILEPCSINLKMDRTQCPPWGINGGGPGAIAEVLIERAKGEVLRPLKGNVSLGAGDLVHVRTGGGGGYGDPLERCVDLVALDVRRGMVSEAHAGSDYGVVLNQDGEVDIERTNAIRKQKQQIVRIDDMPRGSLVLVN